VRLFVLRPVRATLVATPQSDLPYPFIPLRVCTLPVRCTSSSL
jgi:hypothetical protein